MTQSHADLPGQPITEEKSTPGITSGLLEICASEIMQNQVIWASPEDSLQHAFAKMQQTDAGYIMIGLNNALEGIVSKSDITKAMSPYLLPIFAKWRRPLDDATLKIRIKWIMSRPVRTIKPETSLAAIMERMSQFRGRCLPVTDEEGNVQGLVTAFDIFQALLKSNSNTSSTEEAPPELVKTASSTETT
jgi:CBS domain-containing protein